ncbi:MAG: hypothetical protein KDK70_31045, partial [Myxococcales bacterium]|nr:hypothetical protein [Myxococcales bacterium]
GSPKGSARGRRSRARATPDGGSPKAAASTPRSARSSSSDAASLLDQARRAYARGQGAEAYRLAVRSHAQQPSDDAMELRALAACLDGKLGKAQEALAELPRLRRGKVRTLCKRWHGAKIKRR